MVVIEQLVRNTTHLLCCVFPHCCRKACEEADAGRSASQLWKSDDPRSVWMHRQSVYKKTCQSIWECCIACDSGIVTLRPKKALMRMIYLKDESRSALWCCHVPENPSSNLNCTETRTITLTDLRTSSLIGRGKKVTPLGWKSFRNVA